MIQASLKRTSSNFNPLHHEGGDGTTVVSSHEWHIISIHSTTRVETFTRTTQKMSSYYFNPLHHEGGDEDTVQEINRQVEFQSTPPRGWRPWPPAADDNAVYFNPLHHEGGDIAFLNKSTLFLDFNPLHHEGGDPASCRSTGCVYISIHSTTRVETSRVRTPSDVNLFQSTPPRGWRRYFLYIQISN